MEQHTKDKVQYITAVLTLISGIVMCYIAFFRSEDGDVPSGATIFGFKLVVDDYIRKNK